MCMEDKNKDLEYLQKQGTAIKVLFSEGSEIRAIKGVLVDSDSEFVIIKTHTQVLYIKREHIIKITQVLDNNERGANHD